MKKPFIAHFSIKTLLIFFVFFSLSSQAQIEPEKQKSEFWNHVYFGGGIGLSFGNNFFSGTLAPSAIYSFDDRFAVGTAINFSYNSEKYFYESYIIGGSILGLFNPISQIQISVEFEQLYVNRNFDDRTIFLDESYWYPGLYLGAGFNTGPVTIGVRFDVLYDSERSIYANPYNPFVRVYF